MPNLELPEEFKEFKVLAACRVVCSHAPRSLHTWPPAAAQGDGTSRTALLEWQKRKAEAVKKIEAKK